MIIVATEAEKKAMEEMGIFIGMDRDEVIAILIREIIALKAPKTGQTCGNISESEDRRNMTGVERISLERARQIQEEGWSIDHDRQHIGGELALVAALYATPIPLYGITEEGFYEDPWPFKRETGFGCLSNVGDKRDKHERIRKLEIAGALIAAEIDRLMFLGGGVRYEEDVYDR